MKNNFKFTLLTLLISLNSLHFTSHTYFSSNFMRFNPYALPSASKIIEIFIF